MSAIVIEISTDLFLKYLHSIQVTSSDPRE